VSVRGNALTFVSVSVTAETHASEPLSGNGILRLPGVMWVRIPRLTPNMTCLGSVSLPVTSFLHQCNLSGFL
jgi:hypothetical protein